MPVTVEAPVPSTEPVNVLPLRASQSGLRRFTVAEYHRMIDLGILTEDDNIELLEGYLVKKMVRNPPHDSALHRCLKRLLRALPEEWDVRVQSAVTLSTSEPEPDLAVVRKSADDYATGHPRPANVGLLIEVADSSLAADRDQGRIYARDGIPCYWIINIPDEQIEVYTAPSGPGLSPTYAQRQDYCRGDSLPLVLDGTTLATIPVADLLP